MLFDTSFFIDLEREIAAGQPGPAAAFLKTQRGQPKRVTTVTLGEFAIGATGVGALAKFFRGYQPMVPGREDAIFSANCRRDSPSRWARTICGSPASPSGTGCRW